MRDKRVSYIYLSLAICVCVRVLHGELREDTSRCEEITRVSSSSHRERGGGASSPLLPLLRLADCNESVYPRVLPASTALRGTIPDYIKREYAPSACPMDRCIKAQKCARDGGSERGRRASLSRGNYRTRANGHDAPGNRGDTGGMGRRGQGDDRSKNSIRLSARLIAPFRRANARSARLARLRAVERPSC